MSEEQDKRRASNIEMARSFYEHHKFEFEKAAQVAATKDRGFDYSGDRFDDWAVQYGHMAMPTRDAPDSTARYGLSHLRVALRDRLNRAARRGDGLQRAFSIEGRDAKWRVDLTERFLTQQPNAIISGIRGMLDLSERRCDQTRALINKQTHIEQDDRLLLLSQLGMAQMFVFNNLQMIELIAMQAATGKRPDLRRLRKKMAKAWEFEQTSVKAVRPVPAKRRQAKKAG
jgi:hypothetical protein